MRTLINKQEAIQRARAHFLRDDNLYGCAETTFMTLKEAYDLLDPLDASAAMALNGGVAHTGGACGAILGATLAIGMLAEVRIPEHKEAKRAARLIIANFMDQFQSQFHSIDCLDLIELDIRDEQGHQRFIESDLWRTRCMGQIEFAISHLFDLRDPVRWDQVLHEVSGPRG